MRWTLKPKPETVKVGLLQKELQIDEVVATLLVQRGIETYKDAKTFTCYHRHDVELTISGCKNVLYLYRDPVDTIYSQIRYEEHLWLLAIEYISVFAFLAYEIFRTKGQNWLFRKK